MRRALLLLCLLPTVAQAQVTIDDFHADLRLDADATLHVTETLRVRFGTPRHGIVRELPLQHRTPLGRLRSLQITVDGAFDEHDRLHPHTVTTSQGQLILRVGDPRVELTGLHTYRLRYHVARAVQFPRTHRPHRDLLRWDVTGTSWRLPIDAASATLEFPRPLGLTERLHTACFAGPAGSTAPGTVEWLDDARVRFTSPTPLPPGHGLTLDVSFPPNLVHHPPWTTQLSWLAHDHWPTATLLALTSSLLLFWWIRRRSVVRGWGRPPIPTQAPPDNLTPLEVGTLVDGSPDPIDLAAQLVDFARRGYLTIDTSGGTLRLSKQRGTQGLAPTERHLFAALFPAHDLTPVANLKTRSFAQAVRRAISETREDLARRDLLRRPETQSDWPAWLGLSLGVLGPLAVTSLAAARLDPGLPLIVWFLLPFLAGSVALFRSALAQRDRSLLAFSLALGALPLAIAAGVVGLATRSVWDGLGVVLAHLGVLLFAWLTTRHPIHSWLTPQGLLVFQRLKGYEAFLRSRERLKPDAFDAHLPYAIALGVTRDFTERFDPSTLSSPWLTHPPDLPPTLLHHAIDDCAHQIALASTHTSRLSPSSTSSWSSSPSSVSHTSSPGSVGGGFGGGGGGAW